MKIMIFKNNEWNSTSCSARDCKSPVSDKNFFGTIQASSYTAS